METLELADSLIMWLFCILIISVIVIQVIVFYLLGKRYSSKFGVSPTEMRKALKSGAITAIGPAMSRFIVGLGLIASLGAPLVLAHANVAGNTQYEVSSSQLAANVFNTALTADNFSPQVFTNVVWVLSLGCICMMILPLIAVKPLTVLRDRAINKTSVGMIIGISASIASFAYMSFGYAAGGKPTNLTAVLIGFFVMSAVCVFSKKDKFKTLKDWGYVISLMTAFVVVTVAF